MTTAAAQTQIQPAPAPAAGGEKAKKLNPQQLAGNIKTLQVFLTENKGELERFTKGFMDVEVMMRFALLAFYRTPELAKCQLSSILRALIDASTLRVRPGGLNGRGWLTPRRNRKAEKASKTPGEIWEAHFDPGWRGLIDIARRSKQIKTIATQVVRDGDFFKYGYNPLPFLNWEPSGEAADGRPIIAVFAIAQLTDGAIQIEVLTPDDIAKIRAASPAADSGPWNEWESEMCRKSAVKRLCKYLPVPDDFDLLDRAMHLADAADTGERVIDAAGEEVIEIPPVESQAESLTKKLTEGARLSAAEQLAELDKLAEAEIR